jgi:hypothetical protein
MTNKINFLSAFGILILVSLACSFSTANLSEIKLGKDNSATNPGTKFKPEDEIFVVTSVNNAGGKNKVRFRILFDEVEGAKSGALAYKAEKELEVEGSREIYFAFEVESGIVAGSYQAEVVLLGEDGKEHDRKTATFTVGGKIVSETNKKQTLKNKTETVGKRAYDNSAISRDAPGSESDASQVTDFRIKRSFYALDEDKPADMMTRDGDYEYFKRLEGGGTAGFFYSTKPQEAQYVLWGGEVIAGPLTTERQIEEVAAAISKNMRAEHEMRMSIIKNRPTGIFGPSRVYDEKGNLIREQ